MQAEKPSLDLITAVLCDDIRTEGNGKDILIGVYGGAVAIADFPANLLLALWLQFRTQGTGEVHGEVKGLNADGEQIVGAEFGVRIGHAEEGSMSIGITKIPLHINKAGIITFQYREKNGEWTVALTKEIRREASSDQSTDFDPSASRLPS